VIQFFVRYEHDSKLTYLCEYRVHNHCSVFQVIHTILHKQPFVNYKTQCFNNNQLLFESLDLKLKNRMTLQELNEAYQTLLNYKQRYDLSFGELNLKLNHLHIYVKIYYT
jgi:hypothetical protein